MLKYFTLFTLLLLFSGALSAQKNIKLFNGENLNGWYAFSKEDGILKDADQLFHVSDQVIRLYGPKAGYLMSKKSFVEFA